MKNNLFKHIIKLK